MSERFFSNLRSTLLLSIFFLIAACSAEGHLVKRYPPQASESASRILFIAGRDSHGPGSHEHRAGAELLAAQLIKQRPDYAIDVVYGGWPENESLLADVDAIVMYCDGGKGHMVNDNLVPFAKLLADNVGVVALHYAVEVPMGSDAAAAMLRAIGGYFETNWSVNPHWEASFKTLPDHPVAQGIKPFTLNDEWYFNMRFQPGMPGVTPLLSAVAPAHTMERDDGPHSGNPYVRKLVAQGAQQVVAWAYERPNGGRGFGYTGGHFHANWDDANALQLVLNSIVWTAEGHPH